MVVVALSQKSNGLRYCFLEMIHKMVKMRIVSVIVANKRLDDAEMWGIDFSFSVIHLGRLLVTQPVVPLQCKFRAHYYRSLGRTDTTHTFVVKICQ